MIAVRAHHEQPGAAAADLLAQDLGGRGVRGDRAQLMRCAVCGQEVAGEGGDGLGLGVVAMDRDDGNVLAGGDAERLEGLQRAGGLA